MTARLAELRAAANLSQRQAAKRAGVDQADLSRIESGQVTPSLPTLLRLLDAVGGTLIVARRLSASPPSGGAASVGRRQAATRTSSAPAAKRAVARGARRACADGGEGSCRSDGKGRQRASKRHHAALTSVHTGGGSRRGIAPGGRPSPRSRLRRQAGSRPGRPCRQSRQVRQAGPAIRQVRQSGRSGNQAGPAIRQVRQSGRSGNQAGPAIRQVRQGVVCCAPERSSWRPRAPAALAPRATREQRDEDAEHERGGAIADLDPPPGRVSGYGGTRAHLEGHVALG